MKKVCSLVLSLLIISSFSLASTTTYERTLDNLQVSSDIEVTDSNKNAILTTPKVNEEEKIYDFADLFTDSEERALYEEVTSFISETNLDMAIVTIDYNPKYTAQDYADDFYDYNCFGKGLTHDGLLFLIDMDTRTLKISSTGQGILMYDDYRMERMYDATEEKASYGDYYGCGESFIRAALYYFNLGIPKSNIGYCIDSNGDLVKDPNYEAPIFTSTNLTIDGIISLILTLIISLGMRGKHKTIKKATTAEEYVKTQRITARRDNFLTTHTSSVYIPPSSSSSSGRGSSTYRSSSGRSHGGGGGRHF